MAPQDGGWSAYRNILEGHRIAGRIVFASDPSPGLRLTAVLGRAADWSIVAKLYARLAEVDPSPVVELNRGVAVAMAEGPEAGLDVLDRIAGLDGYYLFHSARADLLRRLGRPADDAYERAIELAPSDVERDFLRSRLRELRS